MGVAGDRLSLSDVALAFGRSPSDDEDVATETNAVPPLLAIPNSFLEHWDEDGVVPAEESGHAAEIVYDSSIAGDERIYIPPSGVRVHKLLELRDGHRNCCACDPFRKTLPSRTCYALLRWAADPSFASCRTQAS